MADELLDGEFWLPSQFLTDDDILMDFKSDTTSGFGFGLTSGSSSDLASLTSDDDELLHYSKPLAPLSGSPQSTLCGWELSHTDSGSGSGSPLKEQPQKEENNDIKNDNDDDDDNKNATLDLLNKAAGEVAKMKLRTERSTGTGFFDCSNTAKTLPSPPALSKPNQPQPPVFPPPFYYYPQFRRFPLNMMWGPVQYPPPPQQLQNRVPKNNSNCNTKTKDTKPATNGSNNRPLGLPPSAWPPLPGQTQTQTQTQAQTQTQPQAQPQQPQPQVQPYMGIYVGPQSASVGTGVFLPRRTAATEPKKKSDGNVMKTKNNKGTQKRSSIPAKANNDKIQLPVEWVY